MHVALLLFITKKPEAGQSRSLALGIAALADSARPVLCAVADQPLMTKEAAGQMQVAYSKLEQNDKAHSVSFVWAE